MNLIKQNMHFVQQDRSKILDGIVNGIKSDGKRFQHLAQHLGLGPILIRHLHSMLWMPLVRYHDIG